MKAFIPWLVVLDAEVPQATVAATGPRVVLCLAGGVRVDDGLAAVAVPPGQAAVGPAVEAPLTLSGAGVAFVASVNLDLA